ncbi:ribbon-helix-helix domain-containing protein [Haloarchaeobius amylolyticus]|uniref:ribbon-helix-helix domain-containing protein n=1 Tax=Haloarchaeobius amylolyticus TaxID=1198296 RepID=UPI00227061EA|nr:ribbon-helix-helix domain-containing protein [Haloarchaeobius amylolyticus]
MPKTEVSISDNLDAEIDRLVNQGDFLNRDEAVEELLTRGISAYGPTEDDEPRNEIDEGLFNRSVADQQDPAAMNDDQNDGYTF